MLDERLSLYGFETNTSVKFVVVVDMRGRKLKGVEDVLLSAGEKGGKEAGKGRGVGAGAAAGMVGLREGEMKVVCACLVFLCVQ